MRITSKGQVTIPQKIREKHGLLPLSDVEFLEEAGRVILRSRGPGRRPLRERLRGISGSATVKMTTDEILRLTRG
jgi:AbrB family looped-hinge helix DNA binding protein